MLIKDSAPGRHSHEHDLDEYSNLSTVHNPHTICQACDVKNLLKIWPICISRERAEQRPSLIFAILPPDDYSESRNRKRETSSSKYKPCSMFAICRQFPSPPQPPGGPSQTMGRQPPHLNPTMVVKYTSTMAVCYKGALLVVCYKGNTSHRAGAYLGHVANSCPTTKSFVRGEFAIRIRISFLWLFYPKLAAWHEYRWTKIQSMVTAWI